MIKLFIKYVSIGVLNTALHWAIFALCVYGFQTSQALANVAGFAVAVSFSFSLTPGLPLSQRINRTLFAVRRFYGRAERRRGMDRRQVCYASHFTLIVFSAISLICGFLYSRFIVFRNEK